jgi:oligopeptide/dipeptide ABC transporter ATP-binding protein
VELLRMVGVPDPAHRVKQYPHEFSGGMRQRAMIAMAIANDPDLIIADEPTTALDVTIQAQVLQLLRTAQERTGAATILITHDLGVVAELADRVVVMYAGRVAETAGVRELFAEPRHPYTMGLLTSLPRMDVETDRLDPIPGNPPNLADPPAGCPFHPRCPLARDRCRTERPALAEIGDGRRTACHFHDELDGMDPARLYAGAAAAEEVDA